MPLRSLSALAGLTALALAALVGCTAPSTPPSSSSAASGEPSPAASSSGPVTDEAPAPLDLTFAAGAALDDTLTLQWSDRMVADESFASSVADDGNGGWSYRHVASGCEVRFWQGDISPLAGTGDDRVQSAGVLAWYLGVEEAVVDQYAVDETLPLGIIADSRFDVLSIVGSDAAGGDRLVSARAFGAIHAGLVVSVECPAGTSATTVRDEIRADSLAAILLPPGEG